MKALKYILIVIMAQAFFPACTEIVDFNLEEAGESRLVVFGEITNEPKAHAVYLSKSTPYFYNEESPAVLGAMVTINDGEETIELTEDPAEAGTYLTPEDYAGVPGRTYQLSIQNVDVDNNGTTETYSAETVMKNTVLVEGVNVTYNSRWEGWEVQLFAHEPGETTDFYLFKVYKNGILYTDTISNYWTTDDKFFNGSAINGARVQYFDEENEEVVNPGDVVTLEMAGITEGYYDFINGLIQEVSDKVPIFSGPSANVKGNISNNALGYFAVISVSRGSYTYPGE